MGNIFSKKTADNLRVLLLGYCSFYTISNLANGLKNHVPGISITVANPVKPEDDAINEDELSAFDETIILPRRREVKLNGDSRINELKHILKIDNKRKKLFINIAKTNFRTAKNFINSEALERKYSERMKKLLDNYDIYNFHYPTPEFLSPLRYIGNDKKIVLSFWGSDLLRTESNDNYSMQREAFDRADIITLNTIEMREIFLAKFGRKYLPKIRQAYFIIDEKKFKDNPEDKPEMAEKFKLKHGIDKNKIVASLGYSAASGQRHCEILNILKKLDDSMRSKLHIVIPMMYGLKLEAKDYAENVRSAAENSGIAFTILDKYLKNDELKQFLSACQINLNLRDTDSMNGSFLDSLHAGNINICGAWLPYGKLRRLGINFLEIEKREELLSLLPRVLKNIEHELDKNKNNGTKIRNFFNTKNLIADWKRIFEEVMEKNEQQNIQHSHIIH